MTLGSKLIQRLKKKEANLEKYNNDQPASSFSLWLSSHYAIVQHLTTPLCNNAASQRQTENVEHKWKAQTDHISQTKIPNHLWKVKSHHWRPYRVLARKSIVFHFRFSNQVRNQWAFSSLRFQISLKAYPQNFSDFTSPSLSKSIIVEIYQICMCFFFSFFAFQIVKIEWFSLFLLCLFL